MNTGLGVGIAVVAGATNGLFALPMRLARKWAWENVWLPFSILGMTVFPWILTLSAVPELAGTYRALGASAILIPALWGVAVYTGSLMFGISLTYISTSLAFALLVGAMSIVGVLGPVVAFNPTVLGVAGGRYIATGVGFLLAALCVCAYAGALKARAQAGQHVTVIGNKSGSAFTGMLLAIVGGVLSGMLSLGMSMEWARDVASAAVRVGGAQPAGAQNAVLLLILLGGAVPNCAYCVFLLFRNRTWGAYRGSPRYWLVILLMGVMYSGSVALWGASTSPDMLGKLGPSVGWALFIGMVVIGSNIGGFLSGEWRGAGNKAVKAMLTGLGLIVLAMIAIGYGNFLLNRP